MREFIFLWTPRNIERVGRHDIIYDVAEYVVQHAAAPYLENVGDDNRSVWGATRNGRFLQVIFVHVQIENMTSEEYAFLEPHERIALDAGEPAVRIIHARELTNDEKRRLRRRKKG